MTLSFVNDIHMHIVVRYPMTRTAFRCATFRSSFPSTASSSRRSSPPSKEVPMLCKMIHGTITECRGGSMCQEPGNDRSQFRQLSRKAFVDQRRLHSVSPFMTGLVIRSRMGIPRRRRTSQPEVIRSPQQGSRYVSHERPSASIVHAEETWWRSSMRTTITRRCHAPPLYDRRLR